MSQESCNELVLSTDLPSVLPDSHHLGGYRYTCIYAYKDNLTYSSAVVCRLFFFSVTFEDVISQSIRDLYNGAIIRRARRRVRGAGMSHVIS